ncbi:MAG: M48 family metallopeptidase [Bacteroidales bacterium]|nr:M48 family metallopeptidase [Bacteroidales bacterium]MDE6148412.1 M48 family metallopeptidase [Bacteroidales bacterium]
MLEKIYNDPEIGEIKLVRSAGLRRMSIKVHPLKGVRINVPWLVPYGVAISFLMSKKDWVISTIERQRQKYGAVKAMTPSEIEAMRAEAKRVLPGRLALLAERYGFTYGRVTIRHNSSNWGSCSGRGNISLNLNLVRLPRVLCDYVLLHELCHLRHHDHGPAFHLLLEHVCTDHILRLSDSGDEEAASFAREAAMSKSRYPLDRVMTSAIKKYPLV